jgi:histidine ammonia-lyase
MTAIQIGESLTLADVARVATQNAPVAISDSARERMTAARAQIEAQIGDGKPLLYGINTGFGALAEVRISASEIQTLQKNLVRSHACGVGEPLSNQAVRAIMLLRAQVLAQGYSGCRPELVDLICDCLNKLVHPIIPRKGSVGASGDLAPLAHLACVLIGEGEARVGDGDVMSGGAALERVGLKPVTLRAKEGLCLINGTQVMTAIGALLMERADRLIKTCDVVGAVTVEALTDSRAAFEPRIHALRPHEGQVLSAANLYALLADSQIMASHANCERVQDPYSLRCMPQVHGASRDALKYARAVIETEVNSVTDNPLVFDNGDVVSGGNFHGQPVAYALDFAAIALAELANISERRIEQLVNPNLSSGLPAFLAPQVGLNSGYMIAQVTAAALVSENKRLAAPASVDSIPSSANREDHVSMGVHSALKAWDVLLNVEQVIGIELMCAVQGLDLRRPLKAGPSVEAVHAEVRKHIAFLDSDRILHGDLIKAHDLVRSGTVLASALAEYAELK